MKIEHFAFEVSDLDTSIRYYVEKLGFKKLYTFLDPDEHESLAVLELDGGKLELIQVLSETNQAQEFSPQAIRPHFCPHLAIQTDDFEGFISSINERELNLVHGPLEIPDLVKWLYISDPDHNMIEFFQLLQPEDKMEEAKDQEKQEY